MKDVRTWSTSSASILRLARWRNERARRPDPHVEPADAKGPDGLVDVVTATEDVVSLADVREELAARKAQ